MLDIVTLATIPAVLAAVNLLKQFGITGKWSALAAVLLGMLFQCVDFLSIYAVNPSQLDPLYLVQEASKGLLLGLAAAGLYDLTPSRTPTQAGSVSSQKGKHAL